MEVHISIGPLRVTISFPAGYIELSRSLSLFETSSTDVEYFLEVREKNNLTIPANAISRRDHFFVEYSSWDLCFGNSNFSLRIDFVKKSAVLTVKSDFGDKRLLLFNAFKWFLSLITIDNGGVPLHSSNMIRNNKALLFCGMSGSGKSTISSLLSTDQQTWQRGSDELNLVFIQDSELYAYATPYLSFDSELRKTGTPLEHLFFLSQSSRNYTQTLYGKEIYWNILKNIYTIPANDTMAEKMYNNVQFLSDSVKCSTLYFINNQSVKQFIEDWMDNQYV
jgi:hypothetical protein